MLPHLRPMDTGEILDGAFRLCRPHVRAFLAAGLLPPSPRVAAARTLPFNGPRVRMEALDAHPPAGRPAPAAA